MVSRWAFPAPSTQSCAGECAWQCDRRLAQIATGAGRLEPRMREIDEPLKNARVPPRASHEYPQLLCLVRKWFRGCCLFAIRARELVDSQFRHTCSNKPSQAMPRVAASSTLRSTRHSPFAIADSLAPSIYTASAHHILEASQRSFTTLPRLPIPFESIPQACALSHSPTSHGLARVRASPQREKKQTPLLELQSTRPTTA